MTSNLKFGLELWPCAFFASVARGPTCTRIYMNTSAIRKCIFWCPYGLHRNGLPIEGLVILEKEWPGMKAEWKEKVFTFNTPPFREGVCTTIKRAEFLRLFLSAAVYRVLLRCGPVLE